MVTVVCDSLQCKDGRKMVVTKFKQEILVRYRRELCDKLESYTDQLEQQTRELVEELEIFKIRNETHCLNRDEDNKRIQALTSKFTSGANLENLRGRSFGTRKYKNEIHQASKGFEQQILQDIDTARRDVRNENIEIEVNTFEMQDLEEQINEIEEKIVKIEEVCDELNEGRYPLNRDAGEDDSWMQEIGFV